VLVESHDASAKRQRSTFGRQLVIGLACWLAVAALCACGSAQGQKSETSAPAAAGKTTEAAGTATAASDYEPFEAADFEKSSHVVNEWMPLTPGTRYVYEGVTVEDDGTEVPHKVVINVTDLTKVVGGIRSAVTWDLDYSDGELVEAELAFFAQDKHGNVWRMGEYPEEYEGGKIIAHPGWVHGVADARAGIVMRAKPEVGTPGYSEGWAPSVGWTDRGKVDQMVEKHCVPVDCYQDVLVVAETSAAEKDSEQLKYYARGVGNIYVSWRGSGEKTKETLELVKLEKLGPKALAEMRAKALMLEKSGYRNSKAVYGTTPPAEPISG
jgi:hypothetical protein